MYLIRRVFKIKPGKTREAAKVIAEIGHGYETVGRSATRVYWSGYTVPGPNDTVYMDWTEEFLGSPFRTTVTEPDNLRVAYGHLGDLLEETFIEFYEMV